MTFLQCVGYYEKEITIDFLINQDTSIFECGYNERGISDENLSVKRVR